MATPLPKQPHELIKDPVIGDLSGAINSLVCDHYMIQVPSEDTDVWLRRTVRDAEAVARAARDLLETRATALAAEVAS